MEPEVNRWYRNHLSHEQYNLPSFPVYEKFGKNTKRVPYSVINYNYNIELINKAIEESYFRLTVNTKDQDKYFNKKLIPIPVKYSVLKIVEPNINKDYFESQHFPSFPSEEDFVSDSLILPNTISFMLLRL